MRIHSAKCGEISRVAITFSLLALVAVPQAQPGRDLDPRGSTLASVQPFCTVLEADSPDNVQTRNLCEPTAKAGPADTNERKPPRYPKRSVG